MKERAKLTLKSIFSGEKDDKIFLAKTMCLTVAFLGLVMAIISLCTHLRTQVYISIAYGSVMFLTFISIIVTKKLNFFYPVCFVFFYGLELLYMITGGANGFGILWITIVPIFSIFMLSSKNALILSSVMVTILAVGFYSPLRNYIYQFPKDFVIRFPVLFLIENLFALFANHRMNSSEKKKAALLKELTRLKNNLQEEVMVKTHEIRMEKEKGEKLTVEITLALVSAVDAKDPYTSGHSKRVAEYSLLLGQKMGLEKIDLDNLYLAGLLHDLGKIGIPDQIIKKQGIFTDEELSILKTHPVIGGKILSSINSIPDIAAGVRWHHEHYDGTGYPDQLEGNVIPEFARIIAVADAYDSMTSTRSYRKTLPQQTVRSEILSGKGKQFDPTIADLMIQIIDEDKDFTLHG